ncbi:hypothetical protein BDW02DRAFT_575144, partial [Decorospora gaudefroyi]
IALLYYCLLQALSLLLLLLERSLGLLLFSLNYIYLLAVAAVFAAVLFALFPLFV